MPSSISKTGWVYIVLLFVSGTAGALIYKAMCLHSAPPGKNLPAIPYDHAYMQTIFMYLGQFLDVIIVLIQKFTNKRQNIAQSESSDSLDQNSLPNFSVNSFLTFFAPTFVDVIGSTLYNLSLNYALVSVCQMVRNCSVVFVALFSALSFKHYRKTFDLPQFVGLLVLIIGMVAICTVSYYRDQDQKSAPNNVLGIILVIVGSAFSSLVFVMEEVILRKVHVSGMAVVASEGFWGMTVYYFLIFTLNLSTDKNGKRIEDLAAFNYQMKDQFLLWFLIMYILSIVFYSLSSIQITNHVNAVARSMFDSTKTILVWGISLCLGWEKLDAVGTPVKLVGYIFVVCGTMIYNMVWKIVPQIRIRNTDGFNSIQNETEENKPLWSNQQNQNSAEQYE
ncbi:Transmembrane_domain-containing protein [Hexamita inflata]|uniref:Transmembrane domain-containing protein n=1 Tax=Hexamita inflata TaxID=28002 RepID=A0AA86NBF1_9EUKA|nr:Transmembrane domain-containing protein [Hexamita inflata]